MFIELLMTPKTRMRDLLEAIKIDEKEMTSDYMATCLHGTLKVYHCSYAKMRNRRSVISEFTDFKVVKIYGKKPTEQDQQKYQNIMSTIFEKDGYVENLIKNQPTEVESLCDNDDQPEEF